MTRPALRKLFPALNIYSGEGELVVLFLLHGCVAGIATTLVQNAAFALFLATWSAQLLPVVYLGVTLGAILVALLNLALQRRLSFRTLMLGNVAATGLICLLLRGMLLLPGMTWVLVLLPMYYRVMYGMINLEFWGLAGRAFDVRQGKRLFALIGSGEVIAMIIAGFATPALVRFLGTPNLLLVAAAAMGGVYGIVVLLFRRFSKQLATPTTTAAVEATGSWWRTQYIGLIFVAAALLVIDYLFVDNIFYDRARSFIPDEAHLASFLGIYSSTLGIMTLFGMVVVTSRLLRRFGLRAGLLVQPVCVGIAAVLALAAHFAGGSGTLVFALITSVKLVDVATTDAISRPATGLLFQPLPAGLRLRVQTAANGVVYALAALCAGLLLLLLTTVLGLTALQLLFALLLIIAAWIAVGLFLSRDYRRMLLNALAHRWLDPAVELPQDPTTIAALQSSLHISQPEVVGSSAQLWPEVVTLLADRLVRGEATATLVAGGDAVVPYLHDALATNPSDQRLLTQVARVCGRIGTTVAAKLLLANITHPVSSVRHQILEALTHIHDQVQYDHHLLRSLLAAEVRSVSRIATTQVAVRELPQAGLLHSALRAELDDAREQIFLLLALIGDRTTILRIQSTWHSTAGEQQAYALEALDLVLEHDLKQLVLPAFEGRDHAGQGLLLTPVNHLHEILAHPELWTPWTRACALAALADVTPEQAYTAAQVALHDPDATVRDTATWLMPRVNPESLTSGAIAMMSMIEKVLILRSVSLFTETPDSILAEIASLLAEVTIPAGTLIFSKGDPGTSMYIIINGRVRVHDGDQFLNYLDDHDVFGEMAVLDTAPRVASVTAITDTRAFQLDQALLYELMADRIEVVRGIIRVLLGYIRDRVADVSELRAQRA